MTRTQIAAKIAENHKELSKKAVESIVRDVFSEMKETLVSGEEVFISDFGTFKIAESKERVGRNPQTKSPMTIPASKKVKLSNSKALVESLNK